MNNWMNDIHYWVHDDSEGIPVVEQCLIKARSPEAYKISTAGGDYTVDPRTVFQHIEAANQRVKHRVVDKLRRLTAALANT